MSLFEALLRCLGTAHAHFLEVRVALVCLFNHVLITTTYRVVPSVFLVPQAFSDLATLNCGHISLHLATRLIGLATTTNSSMPSPAFPDYFALHLDLLSGLSWTNNAVVVAVEVVRAYPRLGHAPAQVVAWSLRSPFYVLALTCGGDQIHSLPR